MKHLPWNAPIDDYEAQAVGLLAAHRAAVPEVLDVIHRLHPRFLDDTVTWLPRQLTRDDISSAPFNDGDARLTVARGYSYPDWDALVEHVGAVAHDGSDVQQFAAAVAAVIDGDLAELRRLLDAAPQLARARSTRRTCHDPSVHAATLLHYVAANGVEGVNQRTPANAVEITRLLLERGANPNATAGLYGGQCSVLSMLVSSSHPAEAGVQVALVDLLVAHGASVHSVGEGTWVSPLSTALTFGFMDVAAALVRHGAAVDRLDLAAGLGRVDEMAHLLSVSDADARHRALALASQGGHVDAVRFLLDAGEDPNRYNPEGLHSHATPLHHAALNGHRETVELLMSRGARLDVRDKLWNSTPAGWAEHGGHAEIAQLLATAPDASAP